MKAQPQIIHQPLPDIQRQQRHTQRRQRDTQQQRHTQRRQRDTQQLSLTQQNWKQRLLKQPRRRKLR